MKRFRIFSLISTLCLCLGIMAVGVWAATSTALFNINGNLKYYPEGLFVELSGHVERGTSAEDTHIINSKPSYTYGPVANFDSELDEPSGNFPIEEWAIGSVSFVPNAKFIKLVITITNYSDFTIAGTPNITIDNQDILAVTEISVAENSSVLSQIGSLQTVEYSVILEFTGTTEINKNLNVSFEFEEIAKNYDYFVIENNIITGISDTYTTEKPEILVIPGYSEDGTTQMQIDIFSILELQPETKTVIIEEGLTEIGYTFSANPYIESITIPSTMTRIIDSAFDSCEKLKTVNLSPGLKIIESSAFRNCRSLTSIEIPEGVTTVVNDAFQGCINLESVSIPSTITDWGQNVFMLCENINTISLAEGLKSIPSGMFSNLTKLENISIPSTVTSIGQYAFLNCTSLKSITIPSSVNDWPPTMDQMVGGYNNAFSGCTSLSEVILSEGLTTLGDYTFEDCVSLTKITIPSSMTDLGFRAFSGCNSLTTINVEEGNSKYYSENNCVIESSTKKLVLGCATSTIPNNVEIIGSFAFDSYDSLKGDLIVPEGVVEIQHSAFINCSGITNIILPTTLTSIYANLNSFRNMYPSFYGCSALESITIQANTPPTLNGSSAFSDLDNLSHIYVPAEAVDAYKAASGWSDYADLISAIQ